MLCVKPANPSYSGCDSAIELPLDGGCKRQRAKLNFEVTIINTGCG